MGEKLFMKKILSITSLVVALLIAVGASAKPVDVRQARSVAETFLQGVGCKNASNINDYTADLAFSQFYLFAADEGGFVLVSADDCVMPILGYSTTERFNTREIPAHIADWLAGYERQISSIARQGESSGAVAQQWDLLLKGAMPKAELDTCVSPLLTTTWDQSPLYNNSCPGGSVAGCTAIATAQVMKYWNFPSKGYGSHSYVCGSYGTLSADFANTTYQWSKMTNALTSSSLSFQVNAVATLVYHIGVAVNMGYSPSGSGAWTDSFGTADSASAENALKQYFKYKSSLYHVYRTDHPAAVFDSILRNELNNGRPIIYSGSGSVGGHAFNLDGYDVYGDFHVNWGWGGSCNGYYTMGALDPVNGTARLGYGFNYDEGAIIGIEPNYDFDTTAITTVSVASNNAAFGNATGSGTFSFGDTVTLYAAAAPNCRFVRWSDNNTANNRRFVAMGGDYVLTAYFEPLSGDTLGYAPSTKWVYTLGSGNDSTTICWGIRLPAAVLSPGHSLTAVQTYVCTAGDYRAVVFLDSTVVADQTFSATSDELYYLKTVTLDTPVRITGHNDVYIYTYNTGIAKPIALSYDGGNDNELLLGGLDSVVLRRQYSAMMRGIFALDPNEYTLTVSPNDSDMGTVSGGGTYAAGTAVSLSASPNQGYFFNSWSDGVTDNPRTVVVAEDLSLVANFSTHEGIEDARLIEVALYPNPTTGRVRIDASNVEQVRVYDQTGREVYVSRNANDVDLSQLSCGIYTLHIILPQGCAVKKVVKSDN